MSVRAPLILALDTSGADAGLALAGESRVDVALLSTHQHGAARTEDLGTEAERLLSARGRSVRDLTLLAAVVGPGSYTGLRAGLAFLRGLAFGDSLSAVGIGTLELLAWRGAAAGETVVAAAPAGGRRYVAGSYARGANGVHEVAAPQIVEADDFADFLVVSRGAGKAALVLAPQVGEVSASGGRGPTPTIEEAVRAGGMQIRAPLGGALEQLVQLAVARMENGLFVRVDELLPVYVGQSSARPNRHRVALAGAAE